MSPSGPIDHQLSVTGDEAVSEASDVDEPDNAEGLNTVPELHYSKYCVYLFFSICKCRFTTQTNRQTDRHIHTHTHYTESICYCWLTTYPPHT